VQAATGWPLDAASLRAVVKATCAEFLQQQQQCDEQQQQQDGVSDAAVTKVVRKLLRKGELVVPAFAVVIGVVGVWFAGCLCSGWLHVLLVLLGSTVILCKGELALAVTAKMPCVLVSFCVPVLC
jgi:hypothetical protein